MANDVQKQLEKQLAALQNQMNALMEGMKSGNIPAPNISLDGPAARSRKPAVPDVHVAPTEETLEAGLKRVLSIRVMELEDIRKEIKSTKVDLLAELERLTKSDVLIDASSGKKPAWTWNGKSDSEERTLTLVRLLTHRPMKRTEIIELTKWDPGSDPKHHPVDLALVNVRRRKPPPYMWKLPTDYGHSPIYALYDIQPPDEFNGELEQPVRKKREAEKIEAQKRVSKK